MERELTGPRGPGSSGFWLGRDSLESLEVVFEAGDDSFMSGRFGGPASVGGVVAKGSDVGELRGDRWCELGGGGEVRAGLTDVRVRACFGGEVAAAVAVSDTSLEYFGSDPLDVVGDGSTVDDGSDGDAAAEFADG